MTWSKMFIFLYWTKYKAADVVEQMFSIDGNCVNHYFLLFILFYYVFIFTYFYGLIVVQNQTHANLENLEKPRWLGGYK